MSIILNGTSEDDIRSHGEETFPEECCGILIGTTDKGIPKVIKTKRMRNINSGSKNTRYNIDPRDLIKLEKELDEIGMEMIGIYHSHPNHPSKPSETDLKFAWPNLSYIVLSVQDGTADLLTSWRLDDRKEKFLQETIGENR